MTNFQIAAVVGLILAAGTAQAEGKNALAGAQAPAPAAPAPAAAETQAGPATQTAPAGSATQAAPATQASTAATGLVQAADPQGVLGAMQSLGYTASLGTDAVGDPMISGELGGVPYQVLFFGCEAGANCQWLVFSTGYDLPNGGTQEMVNQWNASKLVGQAFLDAERDPMLNYFVTTTGGLTQENFADVVDWWRVAVEEFSSAVGGA